jgi:hypothetical protein
MGGMQHALQTLSSETTSAELLLAVDNSETVVGHVASHLSTQNIWIKTLFYIEQIQGAIPVSCSCLKTM